MQSQGGGGGWATVASSGSRARQHAAAAPMQQGRAGGMNAAQRMAASGAQSAPHGASPGKKPKVTFQSWCAEQMLAITGSDDITLLEFCATLASPAEVNEYLQTYLGSTAEVSAFTREFLKRRPSNSSSNEGTGKKKKKKGKGLDSSMLGFSSGLDTSNMEVPQ